MGDAVPYAADRMSLFDAATAGRRTWSESTAVFDRLRSHLTTAALDPSIAAVAVCGSLARMEYTAASDLDVLVILRDDAYHEGDEADSASESVWQAIAAESPRRPRTGGTFSRPISTKALADLSQLGAATEQWDAFGKRINLLLASQPVYGATHFERALERVAEAYATAGSLCGDATWSVLGHDVARHFHCVAANRSRKMFAQDPPDIASYVKFRFSVTLAHEAFLLLLHDIASRPQPDVPQLLAALRLTPMERVGHVCDLRNDLGIEVIASCYWEFIEWSSDRGAGRESATGGDRELASLMRRATQMRQEFERLSLLQRCS
jgi:hypothetical protein